MSTNYEAWCDNNKNLIPLVRALKSSLPEQYIGFYLAKVFGDEIEYQAQFDWLDRMSLDIYIPSLQLAVEYDGTYYHSKKEAADNYKNSLCRSHGIYLIRIKEKTSKQEKSRKRNEVNYYFAKNYKNIDVAIHDLCLLINKRLNVSIDIDADLNRDANDFIAYVQYKYYQKSIAYVWPESKDYWLDEENGTTIFDVLYTDIRPFILKCPRCNRQFHRSMKYYHDRRSLIPCECEFKEIEKSFEEAIRRYKETGEFVPFDDSLQSRRLYDRMAYIADNIWRCKSKAEAELYKKLGFKNPYIDVYLSLVESGKIQEIE